MSERRRTTGDLVAECILKAQEIEDLLAQVDAVTRRANNSNTTHAMFARISKSKTAELLKSLRISRDGRLDEDLLKQASGDLNGKLPKPPAARRRKKDA